MWMIFNLREGCFADDSQYQTMEDARRRAQEFASASPSRRLSDYLIGQRWSVVDPEYANENQHFPVAK